MPGQSHKYSKAELLEEIERVADEIDRTPRTKDINSHAKFHTSTLLRRFDSYSAALQEAGFEPNHKPSIEVECDNCGTEFSRIQSEVEGKENLFCTQDCQTEFLNKTDIRAGENHPCWKGGDVTVECSNCGAELARTRHRVNRCDEFFCDGDCKGQWQSENVSGESHPSYSRAEVPCSNCGEQVAKMQSFLEAGMQPFCGKECHDEWQQEFAPTGSDHPNYARIETECGQCDKELQLRPYEYNPEGENFCDMECYSDHLSDQTGEKHPNWKPKVTVECAYCGCDIDKIPSEAKKHDRFYCSIECNRQWKRENWKGENAPNWQGGWNDYYGPNWEKQRRKARENDDFACQGCGLTQLEHLERWGERLHVHHIVPFREHEGYEKANALDNLVTLCRKCHHSKWEGIPLRPQLAASD
ncbi:HNH endonuclease [Natrinema sp. DC36]|uniref:homing endonuclease associated repeat-containing protein n=1 Tax=Natrinema sp. DC36 TaxID=2878680 RepID=UPI001CF07E35|nr:HNH endonuclease [Natrinema sp. DC36]